ncbi:MAG: iron export ABC transporter permease subunit FetB [Anaerolineae bacterium]|jgi:putative ABC transport system permease protein
MLSQFIQEPRILGMVQAAITIVLSLSVILLARRWRIHLERDTLIALGRGLVQVIAVGAVLLLLLQGPLWTSILVLLAMIILAATIATRRAEGISGAFWVSLFGIGIGSGVVIAGMTWLGVIDSAPSSLIPVGSMLIANAMNTGSLAMDRFRSEIQSNVGQIEAALSLGAEPKVTVTRHVEAAVQASMIPRIDSLRSLGIVWIPGLMAGMILSGEDPVYAAIYQFVVIAMIFATAGITSISSTLLIRTRAFSSAQQLILRPGSVDTSG